MMNVGDSFPCFEVQIQATCRADSKVQHMSEEQILEKVGATSEPNQSSQRILQRKEFSEETTSIHKRRGSSTSNSHFKLVQQMKYASAHLFLRLGKYYLRDQGRPTNHYSWRIEIMRNVEKMRALDLERRRH
jgi:hypothetical protein